MARNGSKLHHVQQLASASVISGRAFRAGRGSYPGPVPYATVQVGRVGGIAPDSRFPSPYGIPMTQRLSFLLLTAVVLTFTACSTGERPSTATAAAASAKPGTMTGTATTPVPAPGAKPVERRSPTGDAVYVTTFRDPSRSLEAHRLAKEGATSEPLTVTDAAGSRMIAVTVVPIPGTGHVLHRALVDGLTPASEVKLRFGTDEVHRVRTLPTTLDRPLRIANGGDTMHKPEWFANTNKALAARDPDLVVFGGDLAYEDGKKGERVLTWIRTYHETARAPDGRLLPFISCIGNHEVDGHYGGDISKAPFFFAMMPIDGIAYRAVDVGEQVSFLLLDSDHATRIPGAQTTWLKGAITSRANRTHVIPVYHYPAWPTVKAEKGKTPYDNRVAMMIRDLWVPLFEANGVRVALEHDQHTYKRTVALKGGKADPTGITYLGDGAWGVGLRKTFPGLPHLAKTAERRHGYLIELHADGRLDATAIDEDGEVFDQVTIPAK